MQPGKRILFVLRLMTVMCMKTGRPILARALAPAGVDLDRAATGRVNIRVPVRGIVRYDRDLIVV